MWYPDIFPYKRRGGTQDKDEEQREREALRLAHMEANAIEPDESFVRFFAVFVLFPLFAGELVNVGWSFFGAFATYSSEVSCGRRWMT